MSERVVDSQVPMDLQNMVVAPDLQAAAIRKCEAEVSTGERWMNN